MVPDDDQAMVLPCASVMVTMVLLKVAFTCATPEAMFLRSRRRTRVASLPIWFPFGRARLPGEPYFVSSLDSGGRLLLAGDRLGGTLAGARVGVGALTADRQAAPVTQATGTAEGLQ